jgi:hypothetical protein
MKKGLFTLAFALLCIFSFGQTVHKGTLLGLHVGTPTLKAGVTMQDYTNFFTNKYIPAAEKAFPGVKVYLLKSVRGQDSTGMGLVFIFNSEADRNKYWNNDGSMTELGKTADAKLTEIGKEFDKYVTSSNTPDKYNDWVVQ